jgi:GT2 family glycosyltransferase
MTDSEQAQRLLQERTSARAGGDFSRADALRDELRSLGWEVQDTARGSVLRPVLPEAPVAAGYARPEDLASLLDEPPSVDASLLVVADEHGEDLARFVDGFAAYRPSVSWELIVVGNAPSYDVAAVVPPDITLLPTTERLGWADAVNFGLRRSRGTVAILVDTSVEPTGDFVTPLLEAFADPTVGIAGGWGVVTHNGRQFEDAPAGPVHAVEGYCLAVRREALQRLRGLDPHFRFYRNADLELSFAVRDAGWRALAVDLPLERHQHRGWTSLREAERDRLSKRNFYRFFKRWGDRRDLIRPDRG